MRQNPSRSQVAPPTISTGIFRGMKLKTPPGEATRPTGSKARQATMNALTQRLPGSKFCDLFAGSGAMGIEALSRGALSSTFVEQNSMALAAIRANLTECERRSLAQHLPPPAVSLLSLNVLQLIGFPETTEKYSTTTELHSEFDIIWADPPYALLPEILPALLNFADTHLTVGGLVVIESGNPLSTMTANEGPLRLKSEKKYGKTHITTWQK